MSKRQEALMIVGSMTDKQIDYFRLCLPELIEVLDLFVDAEKKYGAGLVCSENDALKGISHGEKGVKKEINPDGFSHFTAAIGRLLKARKYEKVIKE